MKPTFAIAAVSAVLVSLAAVRSGEPARAAKPAAAGTTFSVDPVHSSVVFWLRYQDVCAFHGRFDKVSGTFSVDDDHPEQSTFDLVIDVGSVHSGVSKRDGHLRNTDFFHAKKYPEIRFQSTKVEASGESTLEVTGDLTLRGETKSVTAEVKYGGQTPDPRSGTRAGFDGVLVIDRTDFGVDYGTGPLGNEVTIRAGITGVAEE